MPELFTRMRHAELDAEAEIPAAAAEAMQAKGWEPVSEPRSYAEALDEPTLAAQRQAAERDRARAEMDDAAEDNVKQVLARVGDDPALARAALEAESKRDRQRTSLVSKLEQIAAQDGQQESTEEEADRG